MTENSKKTLMYIAGGAALVGAGVFVFGNQKKETEVKGIGIALFLAALVGFVIAIVSKAKAGTDTTASGMSMGSSFGEASAAGTILNKTTALNDATSVSVDGRTITIPKVKLGDFLDILHWMYGEGGGTDGDLYVYSIANSIRKIGLSQTYQYKWSLSSINYYNAIIKPMNDGTETLESTIAKHGSHFGQPYREFQAIKQKIRKGQAEFTEIYKLKNIPQLIRKAALQLTNQPLGGNSKEAYSWVDSWLGSGTDRDREMVRIGFLPNTYVAGIDSFFWANDHKAKKPIKTFLTDLQSEIQKAGGVGAFKGTKTYQAYVNYWTKILVPVNLGYVKAATIPYDLITQAELDQVINDLAKDGGKTSNVVIKLKSVVGNPEGQKTVAQILA